MTLLDFAREVFLEEKIEYTSVIGLDCCDIIRPYLLEKAGLAEKTCSVIMLAVPYYVNDRAEGNISHYAFPRDYHVYFSELFDRVLPIFREAFPQHIFEGFADHSPIDEVSCASKSGLGVIGENGLLITEKYSSYVFLGEIICDVASEVGRTEIRYCEGCGLCRRKCPVGLNKTLCLSNLSQKKGDLTEEDRLRLLSGGSVWGCDICQDVCPHSANVLETDVDFFREERIPLLTKEIIYNMSEEDFSLRAYSWRGRKTILRNLDIFEKGEFK